MADVELSAAFGMEPADAVAYFRAKGYQVSDRWQEVLQGAHAKAFTVAKAMRMDVLEAIRGEVDKALAEGVTQQAFVDALAPKLQAMGWWGKQVWADAEGNAREVQLGSLWRLRTIYRTNLQTAFMAGRYRHQLAATKTHPYWMYVAVIDSRTRPEHAAMNGRVFQWDDPIWQYLYPPNGWGCRCRVRTLTAGQVKRMGVTVEDGESYIKLFQVDAGIDERTGEVFVTQHMKANLPGGKAMSPDIGWAYNPGASAYGTDVAIAKKLGTVRDTQLRSQLIQTLNNAPLRHQQFAHWATEVLDKKRPGHGVQALGFMPESVSTAVAERLGAEPSRLLAINEKQLVHADSDKHHRDDIALTMDEMLALPKMVNEPEAVIWEAEEQAVLLIYPADDGRKIKIVVQLNRGLKKQKQPLDTLINAFKVPTESLKNVGKFEVLQGEL